jgi:lysophospholipase L1-like esterase
MKSFVNSAILIPKTVRSILAVIGLLMMTLATVQPALAQTVDYLDVKSTDRVFWRGKDGQNYLIINVFANQARMGALEAGPRNTLLINTALKEGALQFERPESNTLTTLSILFVSMRDMSEYGGTNSNWTQVGTGTVVKSGTKVEITDVKLTGLLPSPLPTVSFPYKEASATATASSIRFKMPEKLHVVVGQPQNFFYENLLVSRDIEDYIFTPGGNGSGVATHGRRGLTFNALPVHVGEHDLTIKVSDWAGKVVAEGATKLVVVAQTMSWQPSPTEPVRILVIGHSLPSMYYPAYFADYLAGPGNPQIAFVGGIKYWYGKLPEIKNNPDLENMYHQASPGYSISSVLNLFTDEPPANPNMPAKSPFIFKDAAGKPTFNMKRYFAETLKSKPPHFVLMNMGDNDTFGFDPEKPDPAQEKAFTDNVNRFLNELREIAPDATFGAIMPNTYNYSDRSFLHNYGPNFPRFKLLQNRQRYIELMSDIAKARGDIAIVPSNFSVDSVDGMPYNSGTHFNLLGAQQFATSVYAWIKGQFALKGGREVGLPPVVQSALVPAPAATAPAVAAPVAPAPAAAAAPTPAATAVAPAAQPVAERPNWFRRFLNRMAKALSLN